MISHRDLLLMPNKQPLLKQLLPTNITSDTTCMSIKEAVEFYSMIFLTLVFWMKSYLAGSVKGYPFHRKIVPNTVSKSLKQCCPITLPNIFTLLKLFATLPLSSFACERSASVLRRLNTYLRCTQTEQQLSALALIHMNYEIEIGVDDVCKTFLQKNPRKMEKANLLFD